MCVVGVVGVVGVVVVVIGAVLVVVVVVVVVAVVPSLTSIANPPLPLSPHSTAVTQPTLLGGKSLSTEANHKTNPGFGPNICCYALNRKTFTKLVNVTWSQKH